MAVKSSGTLGLVSDIVAEFGGSSPYALTDYYRGGSLVPDTVANSAVPTSGTIALTDFYGAEATTPTVYTARGGTFVNTDSGSGSEIISFVLFYGLDGSVERTLEIGGSFSTAALSDWSSDASEDGTGVSIRLTYQSGDALPTFGASLATWLPLTSNRQWTFQDTLSPFDTESGTYLLELSTDGGSSVVSSASVVVTLEHLGN